MKYREFIQAKLAERKHVHLTQKNFIKYSRRYRDVKPNNHNLLFNCTDEDGQYDVVKVYCPQAGQWRVVKRYANNHPIYTDMHGRIEILNALLLHIAFKLSGPLATKFAHYTFDHHNEKNVNTTYRQIITLILGETLCIRKDCDLMSLHKNFYVNNLYQLRYFYSIKNQQHIINSCKALQYWDNRNVSMIKACLEDFLSDQEPLGVAFESVLYENLDELYQN